MRASLFRISTKEKEGVLHVSKWQKIQVLLSKEEMQELLNALGELYFVITSRPVALQEAAVSKEVFLQAYEKYIELLKANTLTYDEKMKELFSSALSTTLDLFYAIEVGKERFLIKALMPVVQLQLHHFFVSSLDGSFHSMVLGKESIPWGLQISYPQLYQDPHTQHIEKVLIGEQFPNSSLFLTLMRWIRAHTQPTPFEVKGEKKYIPIRIGKSSIQWVKGLSQLKEKGLKIMD